MGERISVYLPDELAEEVTDLENTSGFIKKAIKKELGYEPEEEPKQTLVDRINHLENQIELLRKETTSVRIADAVVGGDGPWNRRPKTWEEIEETHNDHP